MNKFTTGGLLALALSGPFFLVGCGDEKGYGGQQAPVQSVEVGTQTINPQPRSIEVELPGRISPVRVAEIRARVAGIVQKRHFVEGANVKAGDLLFTIDPAPFEAALARTQGALARSDAQIKQTQSVVRRYEPLAKANAVSQQEYDDAVSALQTAKANRITAQAEVRTAQLDLSYATVRAPISGRIGRSLVSEGSLVGQGETTQLALIQQMDPIYADFTQPVSAVLRFREAMADGQVSYDAKEKPSVSIAIEGTRYKAQGRLTFSDVSVDPGTGQVLLRGLFPNPQGALLPGMYVRVRTEQGVDEQSIFLPQRAILRGADGQAKVMTVNAAGTAEERAVQTGAMQGAEWQITGGLKAGDQVIVNGADKIVAGTPVTILRAAQGGAQ
ncbi:membrane fusion protein, multidrug efflux system [Pseudomonas cedrina]|uniref:Efflux transporter periplasmic adaptor subunit n=2 Tax=Pseudomonas cedrina TaxID=651740 RepID=A0A1V2JX28_PSECE|nr:efflux RND transporter periplasmic adaptor subunit [Pseudomonas cedrina]ONH49750.1 efflux transporter periplasmic adaptor subunit [Pseudomonas cedrina subsp. cedrina]SDT07821.1 membrane fusion protein, multidrug efflux system [Pseudomonas cedrina]